METPIQVLVELTIEEGKAGDFKMQMPAIIEKVMTNEPGMLGYQWYLNQDQSKCYVIEWVKDSEAWLAHASNVGSMLPALFIIAPITRCEFFGSISATAEEVIKSALASFNVEYVKYNYLAGFARQN